MADKYDGITVMDRAGTTWRVSATGERDRYQLRSIQNNMLKVIDYSELINDKVYTFLPRWKK